MDANLCATRASQSRAPPNRSHTAYTCHNIERGPTDSSGAPKIEAVACGTFRAQLSDSDAGDEFAPDSLGCPAETPYATNQNAPMVIANALVLVTAVMARDWSSSTGTIW